MIGESGFAGPGGVFHVEAGDAEISLGHFYAAIDQYRKAIDSGYRTFFVYCQLVGRLCTCRQDGRTKAALAEARHLNPAITVKWMIEYMPKLPVVSTASEKAGLPEG